MAKECDWNGAKLTLVKPNDCSIIVTIDNHDEYPVTIYVDKSSDSYIVEFSDKWRSCMERAGGINYALDLARKMIGCRVNYRPKYEKLCSELKEFYERCPDKT